MRKYETIIRNLSIKEKVHLLVTPIDNQTQEIANYEFPKFNVESDLKVLSEGNLENLKSVAITWNPGISEELGARIGKYWHKSAIEVPVTTEDNTLDYVSSDPYLSGVMAGSFVKGLEKNNSLTILSSIRTKGDNEDKYRSNDVLPFEIAAQIGNPSMIKLTDTYTFKILKEWGYKGYTYLKASSFNETVLGFSNKATLVQSQFEDELIEAIKLYREQKVLLSNGKISKLDFDEKLLNGEMFDESVLDDMLDDYFSLLGKLSKIYDKEVDKFETLEKFYQESILLLENNGVLPLKDMSETLLFGSIIENESDNKSLLNCFSDSLTKAKGYVRGYYDDIPSEDLLPAALDEVSKVNKVIAFLPITNGLLSEELKEALVQLRSVNKDTVLVLFGPDPLREDLRPYADAIIQVPSYNHNYFAPLIDVIRGELNPSSRTVDVSNQNGIFNRQEMLEQDDNSIYPFGYGLSYSEFKYDNFNYFKNSVKMSIENISSKDGYEVVQIYTKFPNEDYKRLVFFAKVFLRAHEKRFFTFQLNDKSFRSYDESQQSFSIKGGTYELFVCRNEDEAVYSVEIDLESCLEKDNGESSYVESGDFNPMFKNFVSTSSSKSALREKIGMSFGMKLTIAIILDLFYSYIFARFALANIDNAGSTIVTIVLFALLLIVNIVFVIFVAKFAKKRKVQKQLREEYKKYDAINEMIDDIPNFNETASVCYKAPVEEEKVEEEIVETVEETPVEEVQEEVVEEVVDEEKVEYSDINIDDDDEDLEFTKPYVVPELKGLNKEKGKYVLLDSLCSQFNSILLKSGYVLELSEIRALLAAVLSTKMLFIDANDKEGLINVLKLLDAFFGNKLQVVHPSDEWNNTLDLLWAPSSEHGLFTYSDFSVELVTASANPDGLKLVVLEDIDIETFPKYFHKFIRSAQSPKVNSYIKLDNVFKIPTNVCYVLIPSDPNFIEHMNPRIIDSSLTLHLSIVSSTYNEVEVEPYSYVELNEQIKKRIDEVFMDEENWKKIDDLEDEIHNLDIQYVHSNRSALLMERFINVLLMLDPERYVLDDALAMYYIPLIKSLALYKKDNGEQEIRDIIVKVFGADNVPLALAKIVKPLAVNEEKVNESSAETDAIVEEKEAEEASLDENNINDSETEEVETIEESKQEDILEETDEEETNE